MSLEVKRPSIPYSGEIPGGIHCEKAIEIRGSVPHGAEGFAINLCTALNASSCDRALHLSARFHENAVVLNSKENNHFCEEQRESVPFEIGKDFTIRIEVETPCFKIVVGQSCWKFCHRIPFERVKSLLIEGSVNIETIKTFPINNSLTFEETQPYIPFLRDIPGGIQDGKVIEIRGSVLKGADLFEINLCTGQNIKSCDRALHFGVRFNENAVVLNSREGGSWAVEERGGSFPFEIGKQFTIRIEVETPFYKIAINGQNFWEFWHRIPVYRISSLLITGHVKIEKIVIPLRSNSLTFEVTQPASPCFREIPGGIKPGQVIEVIGIIPLRAEWFAVNLCTGFNTSSCDRALNLSARFLEGVVVLNSREENSYRNEERYWDVPFEIGKDFVILIEVKTNYYKININSPLEKVWNFKHRIPVESVRGLLIEGSVIVNTIVIPETPCLREIPGGVKEGKVIEIRGSQHTSKQFEISLCTGQDISSCDRPLHLNVNFLKKAVSRNFLEKDLWSEVESDGPFPFKTNDFTIRIEAESSCYKIAVNGYHCWQFRHRLPMERVRSLLIEGFFKLQTIEFPPQAQITCEPDGKRLQPVFNPPTPFTHNIPGGLTLCTKIRICARPTVIRPNEWNINLQKNTSDKADICFHLSVRHFNKSVVLNTRKGNQWQEEEKPVEDFPFEGGQDFMMLIRVKEDRFVLDLDNKQLLEFKHRLSPLTSFETLHIQNDIDLHSVSF